MMKSPKNVQQSGRAVTKYSFAIQPRRGANLCHKQPTTPKRAATQSRLYSYIITCYAVPSYWTALRWLPIINLSADGSRAAAEMTTMMTTCQAKKHAAEAAAAEPGVCGASIEACTSPEDAIRRPQAAPRVDIFGGDTTAAFRDQRSRSWSELRLWVDARGGRRGGWVEGAARG